VNLLSSPFRLPRLCLAAAAVAAIGLAGCGGSNASSSGGSGGGYAGGGGASPAGGRHMMAEALASLGLTDDQKKQIRAIMAATRAQNANADPQTRRANYKAAFAKIDTVLTPDQAAKLHAKMDAMRKAREQQNPPSQS
jgi:Spy/CpxP family protein refolding chaperone